MTIEPTYRFVLLYVVADDYVARRAGFREAHLNLAREAQGRGELLMGGALGDPVDRALLVFISREAAEAFARQDPYVVNGLVPRWEVQPWAVVVGATTGSS